VGAPAQAPVDGSAGAPDNLPLRDLPNQNAFQPVLGALAITLSSRGSPFVAAQMARGWRGSSQQVIPRDVSTSTSPGTVAGGWISTFSVATRASQSAS
jgi:hypothetical protein